MVPAKIDLTEMRFGWLTVEYEVPKDRRLTVPKPRWFCLCDCGVNTVVSGDNLRSGHTRSCGCIRRDKG